MSDETAGYGFDDALVEDLAASAVALDGTDPAAPLDDLSPLQNVLADATVVGMGEATHGTRECFRFKHRLFRFLVEELDYRLFAIEANFSETLALNDYVVDGEGDPRDGLADIYFWTWDTQEVLALVEWMREYNADRPRAERLRFYGVDAQFLLGPAAELRDYLADVDPEYLATVADDLDVLAAEQFWTHGVEGEEATEVQSKLDRAGDLVEMLDERFAEERGEYVEASSGKTFELARRHLRVLDQARETKQARLDDDGLAAYEARDGAMAANVAWLLDHEDEDRIAVWAHDGHVATDRVETEDGPAANLGVELRRKFGDGYYPLSVQFSRGTFQVHDPDDEARTRSVSIVDPPADSVPALFDVLDAEAAFLDLDSVPDDSTLAAWLDEPRGIHTIGAVFDEEAYPGDYVQALDLPGSFDGIMFVGESTRARPIERDAD